VGSIIDFFPYRARLRSHSPFETWRRFPSFKQLMQLCEILATVSRISCGSDHGGRVVCALRATGGVVHTGKRSHYAATCNSVFLHFRRFLILRLRRLLVAPTALRRPRVCRVTAPTTLHDPS
jgi:hypothetical protein